MELFDPREADATDLAGHWVVRDGTGIVASYAAARSAIHDAPMGATEFNHPEWTVERVRETEAELRRDNVEQRAERPSRTPGSPVRLGPGRRAT